MTDGPGWPERHHEFLNAEGTIKAADELVDAWDRSGNVQRAQGALPHYHADMLLNDYSVEGQQSPEFNQVCCFYADIIMSHGWGVDRTEATLFHCSLCVAGQSDLICRSIEGKLVIIDWKRSR